MTQKLLVGVTASIGVLNMPIYLPFLREFFPDLKVIMTECSEYFISKDTMALMVDHVYNTMFPLPEKRENSHIPLARWADLFIVLPATAHIMAQVAHGLANSLLTATILSHQKPIIFFPNMNDAMWNNPATQRNVSLLREYGHIVVAPVIQVGFEYASGEKRVGGNMPMPDEVVAILKSEIERRSKLTKPLNNEFPAPNSK